MNSGAKLLVSDSVLCDAYSNPHTLITPTIFNTKANEMEKLNKIVCTQFIWISAHVHIAYEHDAKAVQQKLLNSIRCTEIYIQLQRLKRLLFVECWRYKLISTLSNSVCVCVCVCVFSIVIVYVGFCWWYIVEEIFCRVIINLLLFCVVWMCSCAVCSVHFGCHIIANIFICFILFCVYACCIPWLFILHHTPSTFFKDLMLSLSFFIRLLYFFAVLNDWNVLAK